MRFLKSKGNHGGQVPNWSTFVASQTLHRLALSGMDEKPMGKASVLLLALVVFSVSCGPTATQIAQKKSSEELMQLAARLNVDWEDVKRKNPLLILNEIDGEFVIKQAAISRVWDCESAYSEKILQHTKQLRDSKEGINKFNMLLDEKKEACGPSRHPILREVGNRGLVEYSDMLIRQHREINAFRRGGFAEMERERRHNELMQKLDELNRKVQELEGKR